MQKLLVVASLSILVFTGCANSDSPEETPDQSQTDSQMSAEFDPSSFSIADYYESTAITDETFNIGQLSITNNGVKPHDLVSVADNLACQTYLENAMMVDLEITNNYDQAITYGMISDIWGISDVTTDKTIEFMESEDFAQDATVLSDEFYGTLDPYLFQGDYLGTCFEQQNDRFSAQPGETVNYPLYFSLPDRWTDGAEDWYLALNPNTYSLPADHPIKELEQQGQMAIIKLDI